MNIANYLTTVNRAGETGHYPLSTETLAFIQEQIQLLSSLAQLVGKDTILKPPTTTEEGIAVLQGEVVAIAPLTSSLKPNTSYSLKLEETSVDIETAEDVYKNARILRTAHLIDGHSFKTNSRGDLEIQASNLQRVEDLLADLKERIDKETIYGDSINYAPLFTENIAEIRRHMYRRAIITSFPNIYPEADVNAPFMLHEEEILGATLSTSLIDLGGKKEYPSFRQELTTPDGVVYERYVFDERALDVTSSSYKDLLHPAFKRNIPWKAKAGCVIGTMTLTPGGEWQRTGIFRYGKFLDLQGDVTITEAHRLLAPDKCQIQVSASPDLIVPHRTVRPVWVMNRDKTPGIRLKVIDSQNEPGKVFVSVTAVALQTDNPWKL